MDERRARVRAHDQGHSRDLADLGFPRARRPPRDHHSRTLAAGWRPGRPRLSRATIQRRLSAARTFLKGLVDEGRLDVNPAVGLRQRRSARHLPGVLSEQEIERLLAAPDVSAPLGTRDRAILELMYSAGTRASETVGLDRAHLDLDRGMARVLGKGRKERLVAVGSFAKDALVEYLSDPRRPAPTTAAADALFLSQRGTRLTTRSLENIVAKHVLTAGIHAARRRTRCATASRRTCSTGARICARSRAPRPREPGDDPDLHARLGRLAEIYEKAHPRA